LAAARCAKLKADHFTRKAPIEGLTVIEKSPVFFLVGYEIFRSIAQDVGMGCARCDMTFFLQACSTIMKIHGYFFKTVCETCLNSQAMPSPSSPGFCRVFSVCGSKIPRIGAVSTTLSVLLGLDLVLSVWSWFV